MIVPCTPLYTTNVHTSIANHANTHPHPQTHTQRPTPTHLHVLQLAEAGRAGGVEAGASLVQLALEPQRLVVQHRELGLQAAVLGTVLDHALRPAQELRLQGVGGAT